MDLYALAPEEFTAARDAEVRAARGAGERGQAKALAALRRPTVSAYVVNALVRAEPALLDQLLELGQQLGQAQADGQAAALRSLGEQRRALVEAVADQAAAAADRPLTPAVRAEVVATLEAALADPASGAAVRTGRLVRPLSYAGFGGVDLQGAVADATGAAPSAGGPGEAAHGELARSPEDAGTGSRTARVPAARGPARDQQPAGEPAAQQRAAREEPAGRRARDTAARRRAAGDQAAPEQAADEQAAHERAARERAAHAQAARERQAARAAALAATEALDDAVRAAERAEAERTARATGAARAAQAEQQAAQAEQQAQQALAQAQEGLERARERHRRAGHAEREAAVAAREAAHAARDAAKAELQAEQALARLHEQVSAAQNEAERARSALSALD